MFGSKSSTSTSTSQSGASINSSGWAVGTSKAAGGGLTASTGATIPRAAWISAGVIVLAYIYFKKKKAK